MLLRSSPEPTLPDAAVLKRPLLLEEIAAEGRANFYFFCKGILGYQDMNIETHKKMCDFVKMDHWKRKGCYVPRFHFKTSVGTIADPLHRTVIDPNWSTLIVHENVDKGAEEALTPIKDHLTKNRLFMACYPEILPDFNDPSTKWHEYGITTSIPAELAIGQRAPLSFQVIGITGNPEGKHRRLIVLDDTYAREASNSPAMAERVLKFVRNVSPLLRRPADDFVHFFGTPWGDNLLWEYLEKEVGCVLLNQEGTGIFSQSPRPRYLLWKRSYRNTDGTVIFPNVWAPKGEETPEKIEEGIENMKQDMGPHDFAAQIECNPLGEGVKSFNLADLRYYDATEEGIICVDHIAGTRSRPWTRADCDCISILDPAIGEKAQHSQIAMATLWRTPENHIICVDAWAERGRPKTSRDPLQMGWLDQMYAWQRIYSPRTFYIEGVAFQKTIGRDDITERNYSEAYPIAYEDILLGGRNAPKKDMAIRSILQPILCQHRLFIGRHMTKLIDELDRHPKGRDKDLLDCLRHGIPKLYQPPDAEEQEGLDEYEEEGWQELGQDTGYGLTY